MQVSARLFTPELPACRLRRIGAHTGCRQPPTFSFGAAFLMSLAIVLAGFVGELVLSAVKRSLGAKDWGAMIAGHGGALDRVDSICFAAPVFFHLVRYLYVP
jgi:predicted CDP-diglyceride synthetase/phosphatidate cytidylyltransferase